MIESEQYLGFQCKSALRYMIYARLLSNSFYKQTKAKMGEHIRRDLVDLHPQRT